MLQSARKIRFAKGYYPYVDQVMSGIELDYDIDQHYAKVIIKEKDESIWEGKSMAATLIELPGREIEISIEKDSPYKIVHEMVAYVLTKNKTDVKLINFVEPPYDPQRLSYLNMSPDFYEEVDGEMMFGELGTKADPSDESVSNAYGMKLADLTEKVRGAGLKNKLFCIIVSSRSVYTDLNLSDDQVDLLCAMFRLGTNAFYTMCSRFGLNSQENETPLANFRNDFDILMMGIDLPSSENPLIISDSKIDYWYSEIPKVKINEISKSLLRECHKDALKYTEKVYDHISFESDFLNFDKKVKSEGSRERKGGKIFKIPFPKDNYVSRVNMKFVDNPSDNKYVSLLNHCVSHYTQTEEEEPKVVYENDPGIWEQTSHREFGFIEKDFDKEEKEEFSKLGPFAKSTWTLFSDGLRDESKLQVDLSSDTSYIEDFLRDYNLLNKVEDEMSEIFSDFKKICDFVLNNFEEERIRKDLLRFESEFSTSKLGQQCQFMTLIAQELDYKISKISSKVGLYFTEISKTGWYMMSRPTGTHLFYCLVRFNNGKTPLFHLMFDHPVVNTPDVTIFPWRSTDRDRITTWLTLYENMTLVYSDILSHYMYNKTEVSMSKLLFTFLINCDNKQTTSDALYLWREMSMKLCSGDEYSRPGEIFDKLPKIRSALCAFIVQRMRQAGNMMLINRPRKVTGEDKESEDVDITRNIDILDNAVDLITLLPEIKFENMIYTSYLACYHSYATMSPMAANFKIAEKVAEYELKLRECRPLNMGFSSVWGDIRDHEFNLQLSLLGGLLRRKMFKDIYQEAYEDFMYMSLRKSLRKSFLDFATFKASLNRFNDNYFKPLEKVSTVKAIETLRIQFDVLNKCTTSPYDDLKQLFEFLKDPIHAKIDKKLDQAKGLREILTMDMMSRFFLNIIERFMDILNKDSPSEVLSKGSQKERINKTIDDAIYELSEEGFDLIVIDQTFDHSKWCQMFIMNKFASHLCPMLPKQIFRLFCAILNKITEKRIFLGKDFMMKMMSNDKFYSETINELREQFKGKSEFNDLLDPMEIALKNMSNMGQGWLQNLSSSDGDTDMQVISSVMEIWLKKLRDTGKVPDDTKIYNFRIGSSDDQKQRKIIKIRSGNSNLTKSFMRLCGMLPMVVSKHSCKKMASAKTELFNMNLISEFNQLFTSGNTVFVGTCKFTRACLEIPVTLSLNERFENFSNTRRNLIENGIDIFTSSLAQMMQMRVHYRSLGLSTDRIFSKYLEKIIENPSPYFGFFPWEPCSLLGMFGNESSIYNLVMKNQNSRSIMSKMLSNLDLRMGARGELGPSINFRLTKKEKFKNFKKKFEMDTEYFSRRPHILYTGAETREDTRNMINAKASMSEAELSFVYDSTSKTFASSFLILREPVIKLSVLSDGSRINKRMNIFGLIETFTKELNQTSIEDILPIFPSAIIIDTIRSMSPDLSESVQFPSRDFARRRSTFHFSNVVGQMDIPLIDCVSQIWFGRSSGHNSKLTLDSFKSYKSQLPWLRDTHEETMKNGLFNFENAFQLKNTLESLKQSEKRFSIVSPIKQSQLDRMISNFQKYNYKRGFILTDVKIKTNSLNVDGDMFRVARVINGPFSIEEKIYELESLDLSSYKPEYDNNSQRRKIYLLWSLLRRRDDSSIKIKDIVSLMLISGKEFIPYYKLPQKKINGKYQGNLILDMIYESNLIQIEFISGELKVVSNGLTFLNSKSKDVTDMISKLGLADKTITRGHRITSSGIIERSNRPGYQIDIRRTFPGFDESFSKLDFDFTIELTGRVKIRILTSKQEDEFDYSFFISDWQIAGLPKEDVRGYQEKWIDNKPLTKSEMKQLISENLDWAKITFKFFMDSRVIPSSMIQERSKQEVTQLNLDEEILQLFKMSKNTDLSVMDSFAEEAGFLEVGDDVDLLMIDNDRIGIEILEMDISKFEYTEEIRIGRIGMSIFDNLINELAYMGVYELYKVDYRLPIDSSDEWFQIFKILIDYDKRPLLEKYKSSESSSPQSIKLGQDKIIVRYKGIINKTELRPAIELFSNTVWFEEDDTLPVNGVFIDINDHREHLKVKGIRKNRVLDTFLSYLLDKLGIDEDKPKLIVDKRTQIFEYSKEEIELSNKVKRYWDRFRRNKDDFSYAPELGEFFVDNPIYRDE